MSLTHFRINSLTTRGKQLAAAALLTGGPYTMRLGLAPAPDGVTGEPTPGVSGYARQTVTLSASAGQVVVTSAATFGTFTANLGPARAFAIADATGQCIVAEWLEQQRMMNSGTSFTYAAGELRISF
ncbi:MAG: hypothetical protein N2483_03920 [Burkholderiaceae bacterium]|nr:hypothetical protein [Burkholderiaceae bacterium]